MKVGDLVTYDTYTEKYAVGIPWTGLIIETGVYTGRRDVKVMWQSGDIQTNKSLRLKSWHFN